MRKKFKNKICYRISLGVVVGFIGMRLDWKLPSVICQTEFQPFLKPFTECLGHATDMPRV